MSDNLFCIHLMVCVLLLSDHVICVHLMVFILLSNHVVLCSFDGLCIAVRSHSLCSFYGLCIAVRSFNLCSFVGLWIAVRSHSLCIAVNHTVCVHVCYSLLPDHNFVCLTISSIGVKAISDGKSVQVRETDGASLTLNSAELNPRLSQETKEMLEYVQTVSFTNKF